MPLQDALRLADSDVAAAAAFLARIELRAKRADINSDYVQPAGQWLSSHIGKPVAEWAGQHMGVPHLPSMADIQSGYGKLQSGVGSYLPESLAPDQRSMLANALIGGGIGGIALPALGALGGQRKKRLANTALAGLLGGAGVGLLGSMLPQAGAGATADVGAVTPRQQSELHRQEANAYKGQSGMDKAVSRATGGVDIKNPHLPEPLGEAASAAQAAIPQGARDTANAAIDWGAEHAPGLQAAGAGLAGGAGALGLLRHMRHQTDSLRAGLPLWTERNPNDPRLPQLRYMDTQIGSARETPVVGPYRGRGAIQHAIASPPRGFGETDMREAIRDARGLGRAALSQVEHAAPPAARGRGLLGTLLGLGIPAGLGYYYGSQ